MKNLMNYYLIMIPKKKKTLFTSYLCERDEPLVKNILLKWKLLNPNYNVLYFSDNDVKDFFKSTPYFDTFSKMKNGVAIADFFRICYINKYGGFWFDIDIEPFQLNIKYHNNVNLFDCGFGNISYMFIGGKPNQKLFIDVINKVIKNIENNIPHKTEHLMDITGPRIIQNLLLGKLGIKNIDQNFKGTLEDTIYLKNTEYEFNYIRIELSTTKTNIYKNLQKKYNKKSYHHYDFI